MEVAGLVLGALPLAIQALKTYLTIVSSMRNITRDMTAMILDLEGQVLILQNTCEDLLRGIASDSEIESMIENPYADAWKKYSDEVGFRLWKSERFFQEQVKDMMNATAELREKLAVDSKGSTRFTDRVSILAELKRKASFTLRKDGYADILSRLQKGNAVLSALAKQNSELEPNRWSRSQANAAHLIRRLSAGIFSALQGAVTCSCIGSHNIGLVIAQRKPVVRPGHEEEEAARKLQFDIVLGSDGEGSQRWDRMRVKLAYTQRDSQAPMPKQAQSASPKRRVIWEPTPSVPATDVKPTSTSPTTPLNPLTTSAADTTSQSHITNLCHSLSEGKRTSSNYYGYIDGRSNRFDLYHQDCPPSCCGTLTLREILEVRKQRIDNFGYPERLKLALTLSFGVLHLYSTPWLSRVVTLDDIAFLHAKSNTGHGTCYLDRPFLAKQVSGALQQPHAASLKSESPHLVLPKRTIPKSGHRPIDPMLLSLGLLLIQIINGDYSEELRIEDRMSLDEIVSKQTIAMKMAGLVLQNGGMNYAGAVQWCLENFLSVANLDNAELARQFYDAVISRLETDMKIQNAAEF